MIEHCFQACDFQMDLNWNIVTVESIENRVIDNPFDHLPSQLESFRERH